VTEGREWARAFLTAGVAQGDLPKAMSRQFTDALGTMEITALCATMADVMGYTTNVAIVALFELQRVTGEPAIEHLRTIMTRFDPTL